jgi:hypothetical protein
MMWRRELELRERSPREWANYGTHLLNWSAARCQGDDARERGRQQRNGSAIGSNTQGVALIGATP